MQRFTSGKDAWDLVGRLRAAGFDARAWFIGPGDWIVTW